MYMQDIFQHTLKALDQRDPARRYPGTVQASLPQKGSTDDAGPVGVAYPVTCRARYYDAASRILEDELQLFTHENANELGAYIQQWMERKHDNWEPR